MRGLGIIAVSFSLALALFSAQASSRFSVLDCRTSSDNCSFYRCLENEKHCGSRGYPLAFGNRLCVKYREAQDSSSYALQAWYPKVRQCLQVVLTKIADPLSCSQLEKKAFASHLGCYMETGFCKLDFADKLEILRVEGWEALDPKSMDVALKVLAECDRQGDHLVIPSSDLSY